MLRTLVRLTAVMIAVVVLIAALTLGSASRNELNEYYFYRNEDNKIALTFDDGPHPIYTPQILDLLDKYNIKATFFIIGINAVKFRVRKKPVAHRGGGLLGVAIAPMRFIYVVSYLRKAFAVYILHCDATIADELARCLQLDRP